MFADTLTVTVNTVARNHDKAWDPDFESEIAKGTTGIRKTAITDGESLLRISHSKNGDRRRHLEQIVETFTDSNGVERTRKAHIVVEYDDTAAEKAATNLLVDGFIASLDATNTSNLMSDSI